MVINMDSVKFSVEVRYDYEAGSEYKIIESLGEMNIDEIEELAKKYIGDVFKNEKQIIDDLEYIKERGEELWMANGYDVIILNKDIRDAFIEREENNKKLKEYKEVFEELRRL